MIIIGRRGRVDAEGETGEEAIHKGLLCGNLEVLRIFHVVLYLVVTRLDETIDELVVLDYGHMIVHLFHRDERAFYGLDRLWNDGTNTLDLPFDQTVPD